MKTKTLRCLSARVLLVVGLVGASSAQAVRIEEDLGSSANAADLFRLICPNGTVSGRATVQELTNSEDINVVTTRILYLGSCARRVAIQHAPDIGRVSPTAIVSCGSSRDYSVSFSKSERGAEKYRAIITCRGSTRDLPPTRLLQKLDQ